MSPFCYHIFNRHFLLLKASAVNSWLLKAFFCLPVFDFGLGLILNLKLYLNRVIFLITFTHFNFSLNDIVTKRSSENHRRIYLFHISNYFVQFFLPIFQFHLINFLFYPELVLLLFFKAFLKGGKVHSVFYIFLHWSGSGINTAYHLCEKDIYQVYLITILILMLFS